MIGAHRERSDSKLKRYASEAHGPFHWDPERLRRTPSEAHEMRNQKRSYRAYFTSAVDRHLIG